MIEHNYQKQILIPVLEHFVGIKVFELTSGGDFLTFATALGGAGHMVQNDNGGWDIFVGREIVYEIESELFNTLVPSEGKLPVEIYYKRLRNLIDIGLKYRSLILVDQIIKTLEYFILNTDVKINDPITIGNSMVYTTKDNTKNIICLN